MVSINESAGRISEDDIHVGDVVCVDYSSRSYTVYAVEDDQIETRDNYGSFWIDIAAVVSVEKHALKTKKKDGKKMMNINVTLNESQLEELVQNVDINDYVEYLHMDEWNDYQSGTPATEIIESIDMNNFDTGDEYAVMDSLGTWVSADSLEEILEPYLDEILQDYIDSNL